jgi:hypothetical protein
MRAGGAPPLLRVGRRGVQGAGAESLGGVYHRHCRQSVRATTDLRWGRLRAGCTVVCPTSTVFASQLPHPACGRPLREGRGERGVEGVERVDRIRVEATPALRCVRRDGWAIQSCLLNPIPYASVFVFHDCRNFSCCTTAVGAPCSRRGNRLRNRMRRTFGSACDRQ